MYASTTKIVSIIYILGSALCIGLIAHAKAGAQEQDHSRFCAKEGQVCAFDGERVVMYGYYVKWVYNKIKGGSVCKAETFGLPDLSPGAPRNCYIVNSVDANSVPSDTIPCATDGQICTFEGEREVLYGANGKFVRRSINGGKVCLPDTFGIPDPLPNVLKGCYILNVSPTVVLRNNAGLHIRGYLRDYFAYADSKVLYPSPFIMLGQSTTITRNPSSAVDSDYEFWLVDERETEPMFVAALPYKEEASRVCYEVSGTYFVPTVKACNGGTTYEARHITLRNEAGFNARLRLTYWTRASSKDKTTVKNVETVSTMPGYERKLYLPLDADTTQPLKFRVYVDATFKDLVVRDLTRADFDSTGSTCYKVWGALGTEKISPCTLNPNARRIKFWNNAGYPATLLVTYYDKDAAGKDVAKTVNTNKIEVTQTETIDVPTGTSNTPPVVNIINEWGGAKKYFFSVPIKADFTGELCYKAEGTTFAPNASTCDEMIGDTSGDTRQIRFRNDSGFDAQMIITYFVDQVINGIKVPMAKTIFTGMINGLGGKFRVVAIPKVTAAGMPITIGLQGSATVRNDVWSTSLPADFSANPQPCFRVTGTFFDPQGGKCDQ